MYDRACCVRRIHRHREDPDQCIYLSGGAARPLDRYVAQGEFCQRVASCFSSFQAFTSENNLGHQLGHAAVSLLLERARRMGDLVRHGRSGLVHGVRP